VVDAGAGKIALRHGQICISENGTQAITCNRTTIGDWEKFDWVLPPMAKYRLRAIIANSYPARTAHKP
jgi:hypothetical protein